MKGKRGKRNTQPPSPLLGPVGRHYLGLSLHPSQPTATPTFTHQDHQHLLVLGHTSLQHLLQPNLLLALLRGERVIGVGHTAAEVHARLTLARQTSHPIALAVRQGQEGLAAPFVEAFPGLSLLELEPGISHTPQPAVWPATGLIEFLVPEDHQTPFELLQRWAQDTAFKPGQDTSAQTVHLALARAGLPLPWLLAALELARAAHTRFLLSLPDLPTGATCYTPTGFLDLQRHLGLQLLLIGDLDLPEGTGLAHLVAQHTHDLRGHWPAWAPANPTPPAHVLPTAMVQHTSPTPTDRSVPKASPLALLSAPAASALHYLPAMTQAHFPALDGQQLGQPLFALFVQASTHAGVSP